jgi:transposase
MRPVIIRADVNCDEGKKQRFRRLCQEKVDDAIFLVGYPGCHIIPIYETFLVSGAVRTRSGRPSLSGFVLPGQANARLITTTRTAHDLCLLPPETQKPEHTNANSPPLSRVAFVRLNPHRFYHQEIIDQRLRDSNRTQKAGTGSPAGCDSCSCTWSHDDPCRRPARGSGRSSLLVPSSKWAPPTYPHVSRARAGYPAADTGPPGQ